MEARVLGSLGGHADCEAEHAITDFEAGYVRPDGDNFAGDVFAEDCGVVEGVPGEGLDGTVDGIDG